MKQRFWFCPKCGGRLEYKKLDDRSRLVCGQCGYVLYENPIVGVAGIVREGTKILLGRRSAGSTCPGLWCIPCGYVEYDEDVYDAVKREVQEETGLKVEVNGVYTVRSNWHNPEIHTVGIWFFTQVVGGELRPGDDIDAVDFFSMDALPPLAFPTDRSVIDALRALNSDSDSV